MLSVIKKSVTKPAMSTSLPPWLVSIILLIRYADGLTPEEPPGERLTLVSIDQSAILVRKLIDERWLDDSNVSALVIQFAFIFIILNRSQIKIF